MYLDGRSIIVTGAGRGLGRAYAEAIAYEGGSVVVNDIDAELATDAAQSIIAHGGRALAVPGSVSDPATAESLVGACLSEFGSIDGLVNNAGVFECKSIEETSARDVDRLLAVNVAGVFNIGAAAIREMKTQGGGVIVNITSGSHAGIPLHSLYGASKAAVASLTYGWALELESDGIRVVGVSPLARTEMSGADSRNSLDELADPIAVAPLVTFLLGDLAQGLSGQVLRYDGSELNLLRLPGFPGPPIDTRLDSIEEMSAVADTLRLAAWPVGVGQHRPGA